MSALVLVMEHDMQIVFSIICNGVPFFHIEEQGCRVLTKIYINPQYN